MKYLVVLLTNSLDYILEWYDDYFVALEQAYKKGAFNLITLGCGAMPTYVINKSSIIANYQFHKKEM